MSLLKAYGKFDESDQETLIAARRKAIRKRIAIITLSSVILVILIVSAVVGTTLSKTDSGNNNDTSSNANSVSTSVKAVCDLTLYPDSCYTSLLPVFNTSRGIVQPQDLFKASMQVAMSELLKASKYVGGNAGVLTPVDVAALNNCRQLLDLAMDHLNASLLAPSDSLFEVVDDVVTWLSSAGTYQDTCIDGFENTTLKASVSNYLKDSTQFTSNSLAIITGITNAAKSLNFRRRLLTNDDGEDMPHWLSRNDRELVQSSKSTIKANIVVAKDGSGKYKTIGHALNAVPKKSKKRFVIYVKKGVYYENVMVQKTQWNVMMIGDGMNETIVSGSLNVVDGTPTFSSATFAVFGQGFIARGMGFYNTAGAIKQQAVALLSDADRSVFYQCRFDAFQDTLYTHANRQFYRECDIYGTVDFIFGNSAVVFQNCNIRPRVPITGQQNTLTAQGKVDPNQNTGISIQNCIILPFGNLSNVPTYLGRPWKNYSTTVYMHTWMPSVIAPQGWLPWIGNSAPSTIFYSEYENYGPGSSTKNRVKWKGLRKLTNKQARKFTVNSFINGSGWIGAAGVPYKSGL